MEKKIWVSAASTTTKNAFSLSQPLFNVLPKDKWACSSTGA